MRTVYTNHEIPHLWVHQTQEHARGSNLSFNGKDLFSYAARIGRIEKNAAVFTYHKYSITTSRHQNYARQAACHLPCFYVRAIKDTPKLQRLEIAARIDEAAEAAAQARKGRPLQQALLRLEETVNSGNAYCAHFGLKPFELPAKTEEDLVKIRRHLARQHKRNEAAIKKRQEAERLALERRKLELASAIEEWKAGKYSRLGGIHTLFLKDFMRVSADGENVETTAGAAVAVRHVRRAARRILPLVRGGIEWHRNGETCLVGPYRLDAVLADGTVKIGCHTFDREEIERIAALLHLTDSPEEPDAEEPAAEETAAKETETEPAAPAG